MLFIIFSQEEYIFFYIYKVTVV
uniref:Uncharacterized protein n=1 Tax=Lepeophtheirus salmonis TaxID=72036 RepID=A0A0K2UVE5_LEPSM